MQGQQLTCPCLKARFVERLRRFTASWEGGSGPGPAAHQGSDPPCQSRVREPEWSCRGSGHRAGHRWERRVSTRQGRGSSLRAGVFSAYPRVPCKQHIRSGTCPSSPVKPITLPPVLDLRGQLCNRGAHGQGLVVVQSFLSRWVAASPPHCPKEKENRHISSSTMSHTTPERDPRGAGSPSQPHLHLFPMACLLVCPLSIPCQPGGLPGQRKASVGKESDFAEPCRAPGPLHE